MTTKDLLVVVAIAALICVFFGLASVNAAQELGGLEDQIRSMDLSKSVPALLNYQGFLATADSGAVNETLAMTFRLFDSAKEGAELWSETHSAVEVTNGQFYVLLGSATSFPPDLFDGQILYLQFEVGSEVFSPRKTIVSVAYSQMADVADHAATADSAAYAAYATDAHHAIHADTADYSPGTNPWSVSGDDAYRLTGKVGIGTASPAAELEVIGTIDADAYTINGTALGTSDDSYWSETGSDIYYMPGNVGVGTNTPTARLHVVDSKGHTGSLGSAEYAVYGKHSGSNEGHLGSNDYGAYGKYSGNGNEGILGGPDAGVQGYAGDVIGGGYGVYGEDKSSGNKGSIGRRFEGVYGYNATSGNEGFLGGEGSDSYGVSGTAADATGKGVYGSHSSSGNYAYLASNDYSVYGQHNAGNGGVIGSADYGVYGLHSGGNLGYLADTDVGAYGEHTSGHWGSLGGSSTGAYGEHANGNYGTLGHSDHGAFGYNSSNGNVGFFGGSSLDYGAYGEHGGSGNYGALGGNLGGAEGYGDNLGVFGKNTSYDNEGGIGSPTKGVYGTNATTNNFGFLGGEGADDYGVGGWAVSANGKGVYGYHDGSGNFGYLANNNYGAYGQHSDGNYGYLGSNNAGVYGRATIGSGVYGQHTSGNSGNLGNSLYAINGVHSNGNYGWIGGADVALQGVHVASGNAVSLGGPLHAGIFFGDVVVGGNLHVSGNLSKSSGEFKIDHPLDPENKYLHHSFVESPDMMNIYNGNVVLDENGEARVELPEWFGALNRDFRYQLTCVGGFAPVYIAEKISGNRFKIAGGEPDMEISWQVTGIRQDPYANLNRIPVEEDKPVAEQGYYLHPEAYGQSEEKGVYYTAVPR